MLNLTLTLKSRSRWTYSTVAYSKVMGHVRYMKHIAPLKSEGQQSAVAHGPMFIIDKFKMPIVAMLGHILKLHLFDHDL